MISPIEEKDPEGGGMGVRGNSWELPLKKKEKELNPEWELSLVSFRLTRSLIKRICMMHQRETQIIFRLIFNLIRASWEEKQLFEEFSNHSSFDGPKENRNH